MSALNILGDVLMTKVDLISLALSVLSLIGEQDFCTKAVTFPPVVQTCAERLM